MSYIIEKFIDGDTYLEESNVGSLDESRVLRWKSNDACLMRDALEELYDGGYITAGVLQDTNAARDVENTLAIARYVEMRERDGYSDEEMFGMRSAFGDEPVMDVLTGKRIA